MFTTIREPAFTLQVLAARWPPDHRRGIEDPSHERAAAPGIKGSRHSVTGDGGTIVAVADVEADVLRCE
jgi:hypothetical protein